MQNGEYINRNSVILANIRHKGIAITSLFREGSFKRSTGMCENGKPFWKSWKFWAIVAVIVIIVVIVSAVTLGPGLGIGLRKDSLPGRDPTTGTSPFPII